MRTLSVLMAAYKAERWIGEALASILEQRMPQGWEMEILVGVDDDESTLYAAGDTLVAQEGVPFFVCHCTPNVGPYQVRNLLLYKCSGHAMAIFDADDVMLPGRLAAMLGAIDGGADYVQTGCYVTDESLESCEPREAASLAGVAMYTRAVYERLGGYESWRVAADTEFQSRAHHAGFITRYIEEPLFLYRQHPGQVTRTGGTDLRSRLRHDHAVQIYRDAEAYKAGAEVPRLAAVMAKRDAAWLINGALC